VSSAARRARSRRSRPRSRSAIVAKNLAGASARAIAAISSSASLLGRRPTLGNPARFTRPIASLDRIGAVGDVDAVGVKRDRQRGNARLERG
jgi:hypothetical protein